MQGDFYLSIVFNRLKPLGYIYKDEVVSAARHVGDPFPVIDVAKKHNPLVRTSWSSTGIEAESRYFQLGVRGERLPQIECEQQEEHRQDSPSPLANTWQAR